MKRYQNTEYNVQHYNYLSNQGIYKMYRIFIMIITAILLTSCATPEQQAARAEAEKLARQKLDIDLAAQCDQRTAELMQMQMQNSAFFSDPLMQQKVEEYHQKISQPLFQNCYKLAWENYINQIKLQNMRNLEMNRRWQDDFDWMRTPKWCRHMHNGKPIIYRCG